jgi:hypothetical protein
MKKIVFAIAFAAVLITGCSRINSPSLKKSAIAPELAPAPLSESAAFGLTAISTNAKQDARAEAKPSVTQGDVPKIPGSASRKLVRDADISLRVDSLSETENRVRSLVASVGGYFSSTETGEGWLTLVARVPEKKFDSVLADLPPLGKVTHRSTSSQDVTLQYYDLENQLKTKHALADTYRGYLKSAHTIEDIMSVESSLANLQSEIDQLGGQYAQLADLVDFATIRISASLPSTDLPDTGPTLLERFRELLGGVGGFFSAALVLLAGAVIYGTPIVLLAALLWFLLFGKIGLLVRLFKFLTRK